LGEGRLVFETRPTVPKNSNFECLKRQRFIPGVLRSFLDSGKTLTDHDNEITQPRRQRQVRARFDRAELR